MNRSIRKRLLRAGAPALLVLLAGCQGGAAPTHSWQQAELGAFTAALSGNGRFVAVSTLEEGTGLWDLTRNQRLFKWRHAEGGPDDIAHVALSPDGTHAITADKRTWVVWSTKSGEGLGYWQVDADITAVAIADGGTHVLLGLEDGRAMHIDQRSSRRLEVIAHGGQAVTAVALSADGARAVTAGYDERAVVWDAAEGSELAVHDHGSRVLAVALDPAGERVFSADNRGEALVSGVDGGAPKRLALAKRRFVVSAARFSGDGKRLLTGFPGGQVALWNADTGARLREYSAGGTSGWPPRGNVIHSLAFGGDEKSVLAAGSNGSAHRWLM